MKFKLKGRVIDSRGRYDNQIIIRDIVDQAEYQVKYKGRGIYEVYKADSQGDFTNCVNRSLDISIIEKIEKGEDELYHFKK